MAKTIVWIEDDIDIIEPVIRPLELAGYTFVKLRTIAEALNAIDVIRQADLVLLDMILPPSQIDREFGRYPGRKLLEILRKEYGITTSVIALTVVTQPEVLEDLWKLGVADVLRKPIRPSVLKQRVEEVLQRVTA
jgi:CheY-like chemotaxis protein